MHDPIYIDEELRQFRSQVKRFVREEIVPHADTWEDSGKVPRELFRKAGALGLFGLRYPTEYGGSDLNALYTVVMAEELGKCTYGGVCIGMLVHSEMASPHLSKFGTGEQLDRYMRKIVAGEIVTGVAMTEPDAGSDLAGIKTRAIRDGDDWVLNGTKMFITNGVHGDLFFVAAKTDPEARGSRGLTMFIVEPGMPGFSVGRSLRKTGWLASDTAELVFDDLRVPSSNVLGEVNKGFYSLVNNLQHERLTIGAMALGECQKALELTLEYVKQRKAFGGVLWDKEAIRQRTSQLYAEVEAARHLVYHCAWLDSQGMECVKETSMVKALCGELVNKVTYDCVQFHGGAGYMRETAVERMSRDARVQAIGGGATEVMREEIAKRL
jgi:acyl-CoA dehydrogenase